MIPGSKKGVCFICGRYDTTQLHHIFEGANRKQSDRDGLTCYLCVDHHTGYNGVHTARGKGFRDYLHQIAQEYYESELVKLGATPEEARQQFIRHYIKSYLED